MKKTIVFSMILLFLTACHSAGEETAAPEVVEAEVK